MVAKTFIRLALLLWAFPAFGEGAPSAPASDGPLVAAFPCSALPECATCAHTVDMVLSTDKTKAASGFLRKCQAECKAECAAGEAGEPR